MITTYMRPMIGPNGSSVRDETPAALGALAVIRITERSGAPGGATVEMLDGVHASVDLRTGRPFRVAPWAWTRPRNMDEFVEYFRGYLGPRPQATPPTRGYSPDTREGRWHTLTDAEAARLDVRMEALGVILTGWGWSVSTDPEDDA